MFVLGGHGDGIAPGDVLNTALVEKEADKFHSEIQNCFGVVMRHQLGKRYQQFPCNTSIFNMLSLAKGEAQYSVKIKPLVPELASH